MKKSILTILTLLFCLVVNAQNENSTIYVNDMDYVIGDVKQVFITNRITTTTQADNLLQGFVDMKVNGIRIPIYGRGTDGVDLNPNKSMFDYFYQQALAQGFLIFANPAQGGGGKRIANNMINGNGANEGASVPVNGVQAATDELVNRIIQFSNEYPDCKWLNPFNEDGRATSSTWSVSQINEIYQRLSSHGVNGAEIVGPCPWGLPAAIDVLQKTNIADYITVATSHNLGFNHTQWPTFISLADAEGLPVWDSEVNDNDVFGTGTRLDAALENKVDGLVLYNSWNTINLTNGSINSRGKNTMNKFLKFRTDKTYYVDCIGTNKRLAATGSSEDAYGASTSTTGDNVEWKFVEKGNGYYHLQRAAGGSKPRIRTDYTDFADMHSSGANGTQTYFTLSEGSADGSYHLTLPNIDETNKRRLQITNTGIVKMVTSSSTGSWVSFRLTEVNDITSKTSNSEIEIETLTTSELVYPSLINSSNTNFKSLSSLENRSDYTLNVYNSNGKLIFSTTNMEEAWIPSGNQKGIFIYHASYINNQNIKSMQRGKVIVQ